MIGERSKFVLKDTNGKVLHEHSISRQSYPGVVVWGGRAFTLDDKQHAHPAPAIYSERVTFVVGRDS